MCPILATLVLVLSSTVEEPRPTIRLPSDWAVGTRYHVDVTRSRERFGKSETAQKTVQVLPVDVEVLEKRAVGHVFRWTLGRGAVVEGPTNPMSERVLELGEGLRVEFTTDAQGSFVALLDPERIEAETARRIRALGEELQSRGMQPDEVSSFTRILAQSFHGDGFRALLARDPSLFYMAAGSTLVLGEKRRWESQLANPLGGDALPANAYLELRTWKPDRDEATIEWRQSLDPTRAIPILERSLRDAAKRDGTVLPEGSSLTMDAVEEAATYVYDARTGWPKSVAWSRSTTMVDTRNVESIRFDVTFPRAK